MCKLMKTALVLFLTMLLCMTSNVLAAAAECEVMSASEKILFAAQEITDVKVLEARADAGINEIPAEICPKYEASPEFADRITHKITTQKLQSKQMANGDIIDQYRSDIFIELAATPNGTLLKPEAVFNGDLKFTIKVTYESRKIGSDYYTSVDTVTITYNSKRSSELNCIYMEAYASNSTLFNANGALQPYASMNVVASKYDPFPSPHQDSVASASFYSFGTYYGRSGTTKVCGHATLKGSGPHPNEADNFGVTWL